MATSKHARIEEREVSVKKPRLLLFEESCVIPQEIPKAEAGEISCFHLKPIGSPKRKSCKPKRKKSWRGKSVL